MKTFFSDKNANMIYRVFEWNIVPYNSFGYIRDRISFHTVFGRKILTPFSMSFAFFTHKKFNGHFTPNIKHLHTLCSRVDKKRICKTS